MFHAALLHQMLVAVPTQTTFTINLKRNALAVPRRRNRPNTPDPNSYLLRFAGGNVGDAGGSAAFIAFRAS